MSEPHLQRAQLLLEHERFDLAERELRRALSEDPQQPFAHASLALCLSSRKKHDEATDEARASIHLAPDQPFCHYALAHVLNQRDQLKAAESSIREAIRLDPDDADLYGLLGGIHLQRSEWKDALSTVERGLACDAHHTQCANLRAMALVKLGRREEASRTIAGALARDPDNAVTHANQGWALLHEGDHKQAMEHFREALRLEPNLEWARTGIVETMKARNIIYRVMLRYFLWMSCLSGKTQWALIIGMFLGMRVLQAVARARPELQPYIMPIAVIYLVFVLLTWLADPLFNLLLRVNRFARLALSDEQIVSSNWVGGALLFAVAAGGFGLWYGATWSLLLAAYGLLMILPVAGTFRAGGGGKRRLLGFYALALAVVGAMWVASAAFAPSDVLPFGISFVGGCLIFPWIANALAIRQTS